MTRAVELLPAIHRDPLRDVTSSIVSPQQLDDVATALSLTVSQLAATGELARLPLREDDKKVGVSTATSLVLDVLDLGIVDTSYRFAVQPVFV